MELNTASSAHQPRTLLTATALILALQYVVLIVWRLFGTGFQGSDSYSHIAQTLIDTGSFPTAFRPPVYPGFLALNMLLFGSGWELGALVIQALAGIACGLVVVCAAARLSAKGEFALPAALLYVFNLLFHIEVVSKRETALFTLLLTLFFYAVLFYKDAARRNMVMALCAALALLTRPNALVLVPILIWILALGMRTPGRWSRSVLPLILFCAALLPWQVVVWQSLGRLPLSTSANSGQTLWKGNNPYFLRVWPYADLDKLDPFLREKLGGDITTPDSDKQMLTEAAEFIKDSPTSALARGLYKSLLFFSPVPLPLGNAQFALVDGDYRLHNYHYRSAVQLAAGGLHSAVLLCGWLAYLLLAWRAPQHMFFTRAALALTLLFCALHSLTYPEARYRQPLDITATPLAAAGLMLALHRRAQPRGARASVPAHAAHEIRSASPQY